MTLSGHVNRALFITDSDSGSSAKEADNGSSGSRFRFSGSGEMMDGRTAGLLLEYGAGGDGGAGLSLRYADLNFAGEFGKVSIGHGNQGGEGSVYNDKSGALGIGHGQAKGDSTLGAYFGSLDGGGSRNNRIRYDTPAFGPVSVGMSVGNGDQVSAGVTLSQDFGGTAFSAALGTIMHPGDASTISGSAGVKLPSGITISGAWGVGRGMAGAAGTAAVAAIPAHFRSVDIADATFELDSDSAPGTGVETGTFDVHMIKLRTRIDEGAAEDADDATVADGELAKALKRDLFAAAGDCNPADDSLVGGEPIDDGTETCGDRMYPATAAVAATPDHVVDPTYFQATIGYVLGDTSVGVSWWQTSDFQRDGSEGTAIGLGVNHNLPKVGANVYAAVQNYAVEDGATDTDDTVVMIGTRIKF